MLGAYFIGAYLNELVKILLLSYCIQHGHSCGIVSAPGPIVGQGFM